MAEKTIQEVTAEFEALSPQDQNKTIFQLLISVAKNLDKGFNQMGTNQQQIVNAMFVQKATESKKDSTIIRDING